ncbi:hypothetical protein SAMN02910358_01745 [Lachnospiraceae bacterium XBB1006]|nr:hypothetical protein SAMN02910358_01745 [Lachnospiraceae bacterium XBB1006]
MNNQQIIFNTAVAAGLYTEEEAEKIVEQYGELPLHSLQGWKRRSPRGYEYKILKGQHGIETRLWKQRRNSKKENSEGEKEDDKKDGRFYLAKTYLFSGEQVKLVPEEA